MAGKGASMENDELEESPAPDPEEGEPRPEDDPQAD